MLGVSKNVLYNRNRLVMLLISVLTTFCFERVSSRTLKEDSTKNEREAYKILDEFWRWKLKTNPQFATGIGDFSFDDQLTNMTLSSYLRKEEELRQFLIRVDHVKPIESNPDLSLNIDLLRDELIQYLSGSKFKTYVWPVNILEGPHRDYVALLSLMKKETASDFQKILTRMKLFPRQIKEMIILLKEGMRLKLTMHKISFLKLIRTYFMISQEETIRSPFMISFLKKPRRIPRNKWTRIVKRAKNIVETQIKPAFREMSIFLQEYYTTRCRIKISVSSLPNGSEYYRACLKFHTGTDLTPREIHDLGLKEVRRITARMEEIRKRVKFDGNLNSFRQYLRRNKKFGFKDEKDILNHYKKIEANVTRLLPKYFGSLPNHQFVTASIPIRIAPSAPFGYYEPPIHDGSRPGRFYVNTYKPELKRKYSAMALFLHEAIPGHHLQIALKVESASHMPLRRYAGMDGGYYEVPARFPMNTALTEGWGLYSEFLGEEMGLYSDPYDLFGRLSAEMLRACRLVVDTGIHSLDWSREMAVGFLRTHTAETLHGISSEVDRYITWPGQSCAYKIGELKLLELRNLTKTKMNENFDLKYFHDFILSLGNLPLRVLEEQVQLFIKELMSITKGTEFNA